MTQLYCIYDPEGIIVNGTNSKETKHRSFKLLYDIKGYTHEDYLDFLERMEEEGYTCKPIQIANLEEEVVISKDDYNSLEADLFTLLYNEAINQGANHGQASEYARKYK